MTEEKPKGWPVQTWKLLIPQGPGSAFLEAAHSQHPAPHASDRSPTAVNSLGLPRRGQRLGASRPGAEAGTGPEGPDTQHRVSVAGSGLEVRTRAGTLTVKPRHFLPGGLQRGGLQLLLLRPSQAGGRNEFPPPPITAEGPGVGGAAGGGTGRMLQEEDSLGSLSQGCGVLAGPPSLRGPWAEGAVGRA